MGGLYHKSLDLCAFFRYHLSMLFFSVFGGMVNGGKNMETQYESEVFRRPLRIGIAGLGRAGLLEHLPALRQLPELYTIAAVCDLMKERRDIVEREFPNVRTYRRIEDMLDDPEIDLVDIALPTLDHAKTALTALNRNIWTVVETPLAPSHDAATMLKATSLKARGKLLPYAPGLFAPDFRLAQMALEDPRIGTVFDVRVRRQDYIRRDDWQCVKRCGGGCAWYDGPDALMQAVALMRTQPAQLWSELKRIASLGDAEDCLHIVLKSRIEVTADVEICGAHLAPHEPSFMLRGSLGSFTVNPGASEGTLRVISPSFKFPRRRSSVRTPSLDDMHENLPVEEITLRLPEGSVAGPTAYWRAVYATIRTAAPFPVSVDDAVEVIRYLQLAKQASPFTK